MSAGPAVFRCNEFATFGAFVARHLIKDVVAFGTAGFFDVEVYFEFAVGALAVACGDLLVEVAAWAGDADGEVGGGGFFLATDFFEVEE